MASIEVTVDSAPLGATVQFLDSKGNPTVPDVLPTWESDNEEVATVEASEDGMRARVTIVGETGAAIISVTTTETNTDTEIRSQGTITVLPGDTVVGEITFNQDEPTPTPQQ